MHPEKVHYLHIAAELGSYQQTQKLDEDTKIANIWLLPGCGGSVQCSAVSLATL
jgi:hypothetical protein